MLRLISFAAAIALTALPAAAADTPQISGADIAACRTATDQPICLLKLAMRSRSHESYRENIAIGYAPEVLAAIGPDPSDDGTDIVRRVGRRWGGGPAVQALIADRAGADPQAALRPIREIPVEPARRAADQANMEKYAAAERIAAYKILWEAGHGETALPSAHRPSAALSRAVLQAWRAELPKAADKAYPKDLAAAYREMGDVTAADAIAPPEPLDRLSGLIDAGRYAEAGAMLDQLQSEPWGALTAEGRMEAGMTRAIYAMTRGAIIRKAAAAGQVDLAIRLSRAGLDLWLNGPGKDPNLASSVDFVTSLEIGEEMLLIAEKAPRPVALDYVQRMDKAGRDKALPTASVSALAAMRGWTRLGEPGRVQDLMAFWDKDIQDSLQSCRLGKPTLADFKRCAQRPASVIEMGLKAQPLDTPWDELPAGSEAKTEKMIAAGPAGIDAQLASAKTPRDRILLLASCGRETSIKDAVKLAAHCARKLAAEPEDAAPRPLGVETALFVAATAARLHEEPLRKEMLALAFQLTAREPLAEVNGRDLEKVAIAELRAQGRL